MGSDNLQSIHKWKNGDILLSKYTIYVYDRPGSAQPLHSDHENVSFIEGPLLDISSTYIRQQIKSKRSIQYLVTDKVREYIELTGMYA